MDAGHDEDMGQHADNGGPRGGRHADGMRLELGGAAPLSAFASRIKIPPLKLAGRSNFFVHQKRPGKAKGQSKNQNRYEQQPAGGFYGLPGRDMMDMAPEEIEGWQNSQESFLIEHA